MHQPSSREKLTTLLRHWMEHNSGHAREFREWAEKVRASEQNSVCESILLAAERLESANDSLREALENLEEA
jgi:hypothetical protein